MSHKVVKEESEETIITVKTVATAKARMMVGNFKGYVTTLRADPANTGNIYVGKDAEHCTYPFAKNDSQDTKADLDKLWYYSDNGTEKMHFWVEKEK